MTGSIALQKFFFFPFTILFGSKLFSRSISNIIWNMLPFIFHYFYKFLRKKYFPLGVIRIFWYIYTENEGQSS